MFSLSFLRFYSHRHRGPARAAQAPGGNFGKGAARFKGVDKVAVLMKKLEDAEYMAGWILDLPSVSSDATTTNTKKNDT